MPYGEPYGELLHPQQTLKKFNQYKIQHYAFQLAAHLTIIFNICMMKKYTTTTNTPETS